MRHAEKSGFANVRLMRYDCFIARSDTERVEMLKLTRNTAGQYFTKDRAFEFYNPTLEFGSDVETGWWLSKFQFEGEFETQVFSTLREAKMYLEDFLADLKMSG